jgi:hypothetical protein
MRPVLLLWASAWFSSITVTQFVDDLEPQLAANRDSYFSGARTPEQRRAALQYFDRQWAWLKSSQGCGDRLLGDAGKRCIADRARNGRWSWEQYYRDPIAND